MIILVGDKAKEKWMVVVQKIMDGALSLDMAGSLVPSADHGFSADENTKNNGSTADNDRRSTATFA